MLLDASGLREAVDCVTAAFGRWAANGATALEQGVCEYLKNNEELTGRVTYGLKGSNLKL